MRYQRAVLAVLLGLAPIFLGPGARAATDAFTVRGVRVDVTADAAAAAREAAHAQGQTEAFQRLLDRLLPHGELSRVPLVAPAQVVEYVKDFEVAGERTSDVRYLAEITVRFNDAAVRRFLADNGLAHAETLSKPVVVVPVFGTLDAPRLWEESNPWWAAWATRPPGGRLVPLIVPLGDLGDIGALDAGQALNGEIDPLGRIAARYGAADVLITQAIQIGNPELGPVSLQVGTSRIGQRQQSTTIETFLQGEGEGLPALFARAAEVVAAGVQEDWKQRNLLRPGEARRITVLMALSGLDEWLKIRGRLEGVAGVQRSEVVTLSRTRGELDISFVGNEQQLVLAMAQSDLDLAYDDTGNWLLRISGAALPAPNSPAPDTAAPANSAPASE